MRIFPDSTAALVFPESTPEEWCDSLEKVLSNRIFVDEKKYVLFHFPEANLDIFWFINPNQHSHRIEVSVREKHLVEGFSAAPVGDGVWDEEKQVWVMEDVNSVLAAAVIQDALDRFGSKLEVFFPWGMLAEENEVKFFSSLLAPGVPFLDALGELSDLEVALVVERWSSLNDTSYEENSVYAMLSACFNYGIICPPLWGPNTKTSWIL
jgi:hypothetical protein